MPTAKLSKTSLHYLDEGSGPVLVLVHGFPLSGQMWSPVLAKLSQTWRVIVPDLRGFDRSPWPQDCPLPTTVAEIANPVRWTIADYADELSELLVSLQVTKPVVLCGLSMGGYIALQFGLRHAKQLCGLILCDTRAAADTPAAASARQAAVAKVLEQGTEPLIQAMLPRLFAEQTKHQNPAAIAHVEQIMRATAPTAIIAAQLAMAARPDMIARLPEIHAPTLTICGEHDVISPPHEMLGWTSEFPRARFVQLPDAGHMTPNEQPTAWLAAVQSWAEEQELVGT